jgi:uncharacterized membrane protein (UPF0127 family)
MPRVLNATRGTVVASDVAIARSFWSRFRGLMLRSGMAEDEALLIEPSGSVHTAFMRFPIDVVFLDREKTVVKVAENVRPFRAALSRGHSALEMAAGGARRANIEAGDRLVIDDEAGPANHNDYTAVLVDSADEAPDNHGGPQTGGAE